ncbi:MAG: alpha/beta hydrolase [Rhodovibrio sp.]|nr:alpha/beta hydrolase [Rhodovibrio sp.]
MLDGFEALERPVDECRIAYSIAGSGPPLLLLHGYPQTRVMWHRIAGQLAERFTVVAPDLPGYGASAGPEPSAAADVYSKRWMARRLRQLMADLGFDRFHLGAHDRGARVGVRLCLDSPEAVRSFACLDIVPTAEVWERMDGQAAQKMFHWPFLAAPAPLPERLIQNDPEFFIETLLDRWVGDPGALTPAARRAYVTQFRCPSVVQASCADYRAGATVDWQHDRDDRAAGRRIQCPTHVVWGRQFLTGDVLEIWRPWCAGALDGTPLDCGHFVAEEQPEATLSAMLGLFDQAEEQP